MKQKLFILGDSHFRLGKIYRLGTVQTPPLLRDPPASRPPHEAPLGAADPRSKTDAGRSRDSAGWTGANPVARAVPAAASRHAG